MSFGLDFSEHFTAQSERLPKEVKGKLRKCLQHLNGDPKYPALRTHKVKRARGFFGGDVFEAWVDRKYRITWEYKGDDAVYLRNVDNHDDCLNRP